MNEHDFQFRVRQHLNTSARQVSPAVASRLHEARQKALGIVFKQIPYDIRAR